MAIEQVSEMSVGWVIRADRNKVKTDELHRRASLTWRAPWSSIVFNFERSRASRDWSIGWIDWSIDWMELVGLVPRSCGGASR